MTRKELRAIVAALKMNEMILSKQVAAEKGYILLQYIAAEDEEEKKKLIYDFFKTTDDRITKLEERTDHVTNN